MKCCICRSEIEQQKTEDGKVYWDKGHNAQPIMDGRCCNSCNEKVILRRMNDTISRQNDVIRRENEKKDGENTVS
jgi:hypothetical protein